MAPDEPAAPDPALLAPPPGSDRASAAAPAPSADPPDPDRASAPASQASGSSAGPPPGPAPAGPPAALSALLVALLAVSALGHGWGLDRGFDLAYEGAGLNLYTRPGGPPTELTLAPQALAAAGGGAAADAPTVPGWRTWNAQALVVGTLALVIGFRRWLRACDPSLAAHTGRAPAFALALLGAYVGLYSWPQSPGVESLVTLCGSGALGFALAASAPPSGHALLAGGAGALTALCGLARPAAGAATAVVVALVLAAGAGGRRHLGAALAGALAGGSTALGLLVPDTARWVDDLRWAAALPGGLTAPPLRATAASLLSGTVAPYLGALVAAHLIGRAAAAARAGRGEGVPGVHARRWAAGLVALGVAAQARWVSDHFGLLAGWQLRVSGQPSPFAGNGAHAYLLLALLAAAVAGAGRRWTTGPHETTLAAGAFALACAPLALSAGIPEALDVRARAHLAPWMLLIALACGSARRNVSGPASSLLLAVTAAFACIQFTVNHVHAPAGTGPLFEQVESVALPRAQGLRFDPRTAALLTGARELAAAAGHQPGGPLLVFHDLPGLTYLLDGAAPGDGWFHASAPERTVAVIARSALPLTGAVICTTGALEPQVTAALARRGVHFPADYRPLGSLRGPPALTVWGPTKK